MNFAVPLAILVFLGAISAYYTDDDYAEGIPKPDTYGYMDSIDPLLDSAQSVLKNPLQIALSRIYEMKRKQNKIMPIKLVKKVTSTTKPMNKAKIWTTTNVYHVKTNEVADYGPTPGKFTVHNEVKLMSIIKPHSLFVNRPKSYKEASKNPKFEYKQQTSMGEILKLGRQDLNTSSLLLRFKWPNNKNGQSYKFYLENVFVNNFSNTVNSKILNERNDSYYKHKAPQLTPVTFVIHKNLSTSVKSNNSRKIGRGSTTIKRVQNSRLVQNRPNVLGLGVELWQSEKISRKQEMAKKMLLQ